jgi:formylglycine-generating enzyme required for sulfatase activity
VSRIFLSHSSANNLEAVALRDWLRREGWDDVFLDVDPDRGIAAGERWERALNEAAHRCEAVLFVVSRAWLASGWCLKEFNLAHRLNKLLFGILVDDLAVPDLPVNLTSTWQLVRLCSGRDHVLLRVTMPITGEEAHVTFSAEGLARLKTGLQRAGLDTRFFAWPPGSDPNRPPYRGLKPLEAEDAGIFFGRDAPIIEALDRLRGLRVAAAPRLLVILGASGAGKSSFLRAGILRRLQRDDGNFLVLPVLRPERAAINGETGLVRSLESAIQAQNLMQSRSEIRDSISGGALTLLPLFAKLADKAWYLRSSGEPDAKPPVLVLPIDQGEELFLAEGAKEAEPLLELLRDLLTAAAPGLIVVFTIRSDSYEQLQIAKALDGIGQQTLSLPPLPKGAYQEVIEGPAERLKDGTRALKIEPALTQALLADIEAGGGRDALPLLAFTLERLYLEYGGRGRLTLTDYETLGRIKGSIEAAVERAFRAADADSRVPNDRNARFALLRRGLIPWLAGIDPDTGTPRRRVARLSEIPVEARPLIDHLVEQRLLSTDVRTETGEITIEPAHEALLRQWSLLQGWLIEDGALLAVMEGIRRASRDWSANGKSAPWLIHSADRLKAAERIRTRPDLAGSLEPTDWEYLASCREAESSTAKRKARMRLLAGALGVAAVAFIGLGYGGFLDPTYLEGRLNWVRNSIQERGLKFGEIISECNSGCPEMVVVPAGEFLMGSAGTDGSDSERPQHLVRLERPLLVSRFEVTFANWDACLSGGGCSYSPSDEGWGRGKSPLINVSWGDVQQYLTWLSKKTGKNYRLLSEAEWEYAARAGTTTTYAWGDLIGTNSNCDGCGSEFDWRTAPVGSFAPNAFGLYDMHGNVYEWVADTWHESYQGAPVDGSAWITEGGTVRRILRGGSWGSRPTDLRSANRFKDSPDIRVGNYGFRVARSL